MSGSVARLAGVFALVLVAASSAFGQAVSTASIAGTIRDASGAMLPGVTVTATQTGTGLTRTAVSDATGGDPPPPHPGRPHPPPGSPLRVPPPGHNGGARRGTNTPPPTD